MEYQDYLNVLTSRLSGGGFTLKNDFEGIRDLGMDLFAFFPKYPVPVQKGTDMIVSVGVGYSPGMDAAGLEKYVGAFHKLTTTSLKSHLGLLPPGGPVDWSVNFPVTVSQAPQAGAVELARNFKPDSLSKFHFVMDHPVLVSPRGVVHRETPPGPPGWGSWTKFFNDFVSKYLVSQGVEISPSSEVTSP